MTRSFLFTYFVLRWDVQKGVLCGISTLVHTSAYVFSLFHNDYMLILIFQYFYILELYFHFLNFLFWIQYTWRHWCEMFIFFPILALKYTCTCTLFISLTHHIKSWSTGHSSSRTENMSMFIYLLLIWIIRDNQNTKTFMVTTWTFHKFVLQI